MKRYKKYMDGVKASDTLHQRLKELKQGKKRSMGWKNYGAMAAALALVLGLGGFSAWAAGLNSRTAPIPSYQGMRPETAYAAQPDITPEDPVEAGKPGLGSYEYHDPKHEGMGVVSYRILPYIEYGEADGAAMSLAWDVPQGVSRRDLDREELLLLMGGDDAVSTHLDWSGYELTGWAAWYENGDFWGAYIYGYTGPMDHFEFAVTAGQLPPTCIAFPGSVTQEVRGLTVTADGHSGEQGGTRRVSFMKDDYGYRFDLTSTDTEQAELRVSRLVCWIADEGLALSCTCPYCGNTFPFGTVHNDPVISAEKDYTCPDCGKTFSVEDMRAHVHSFQGPASSESYNPDDGAPAASALPRDPNEESPRGRGENWSGTPDADPDTHVCEVCGQTLPVGVEHSHQRDPNEAADKAPGDQGENWSGTPDAAPDTHVCEVCGRTLPAGVEHSHQQEHH